MKRIAALFCLSTLLTGASVFAQDFVTSGLLPVVKTQRVSKAIKKSTRSFPVQIKENFRTYPLSAEHERRIIPEIPFGEASNAPVGGENGKDRIGGGPKFPGIGATGWNPPDPNLAVGPAHIVEVVNSDIAFFDKATGVKTFQLGMDGSTGFFGPAGATDFVFDPKCTYDPVSGRFFVLSLELGGDFSFYLLAVSDDSTPQGTWFLYRIDNEVGTGGNTSWIDYPTLAVNKDGVVLSGNLFGLEGTGGGPGIAIMVLPKAPLLTGAAVTATTFRDTASFTAHFGRTPDPNVDRLYGAALRSTTSARIYAATGLAGTPQVQFQDTAIPAFVPATRNAISVGGEPLDIISDRFFNAIWRNGNLYFGHSVRTSTNDSRPACRWYQVATRDYPTGQLPVTSQAGLITGPSGSDAFMPAICVNGVNDVAVLYSRCSNSIVADVLASARKASDPAGTMSRFFVLANSPAPQANSGGRWGDYFDLAVDPSNDRDFWGVGQVSNNGWQTVINKFRVLTPIETAAPFDADSAAPFEGTFVSGDVTAIRAEDSNSFDMLSIFRRNLGSVAGVECTFTLTGNYLNSEGLFMKLKGTNSRQSTGMGWFFNWNTGRYDHIGSFPMAGGTASSRAFGLSRNYSKYISSSGQVKVVFRSVTSPRDVGPYTFKADLVQVLVALL